MKLKQKIKESFLSRITGLSRFPLAAFLLVAALAVELFMIFSKYNFSQWGNLLFSLYAGVLISVCLSLFCETYERSHERIKPFYRLISVGLPAVLTIICFTLLCSFENPYILIAAIGIVLAAVAAALFMLVRKDDLLKAASTIIGSVFFAVLIGMVLFVGLLVCFGAFYMLVYDKWDIFNIMSALFFISAAVSGLVFISGLPLPGEEEKQKPSGVYRAVLCYAVLPVFLLLLGVLYLYLIKIVLSFSLPSGGVNPYATLASAGYLFLLFALSRYSKEIALVKFFRKYVGFIMLPVIAVQCVSLGVRIAAYGLTSARVLSVCFIAVTVSFVIGSFVKALGTRKPLIFAAALVLILTVTPLNFIDLPVMQQSGMLKGMLKQNGMLSENGEILPVSSEISDKDKEMITSAYSYIISNGIDLPEYIEKVRDKEFSEIFGFDRYYGEQSDYQNTEWIYCGIYDFAEQGLDVSEYRYVVKIDENFILSKNSSDQMLLTVSGVPESDTKTYPVLTFAEEILAADPDDSGQRIFSLDNETDFYLEFLSIEMDKVSGEFKNISISGYVLIK